MNGIDFIPIAYRQATLRRRTLNLRLIAIGGLLTIMVVWVGINHRQIASSRALIEELSPSEQQLQIHSSRKQTMLTDCAALDARFRFLTQLQQRTSIAPVLSDISQRIPDAVILTSLSVNPESLKNATAVEAEGAKSGDARSVTPVKSTSATVAPPPTATPSELSSASASGPAGVISALPSHLTMEGVARTVPDALEFTARLERSPLISLVQMTMREPGMWAGRAVQQFEIQCDLVQQVREIK